MRSTSKTPSLSVILPRWDEPTVVQMTKENLQKELSSLPYSELIVANSWLKGLEQSKADFVCLVEPDCLVSSGYFSSNYNLFKKNNQFRKLAMLGSSIGLDNWSNKIYGYKLEQVTYDIDKDDTITQWEIECSREKRSSSQFAVQIGYLPGAIIRRSAMQAIIQEFKKLELKDPVKLSTDVSFFLWDTGRRVYVNPNTTYVSTMAKENPLAFAWRTSTVALNTFAAERI